MAAVDPIATSRAPLAQLDADRPPFAPKPAKAGAVPGGPAVKPPQASGVTAPKSQKPSGPPDPRWANMPVIQSKKDLDRLMKQVFGKAAQQSALTGEKPVVVLGDHTTTDALTFTQMAFMREALKHDIKTIVINGEEQSGEALQQELVALEKAIAEKGSLAAVLDGVPKDKRASFLTGVLIALAWKLGFKIIHVPAPDRGKLRSTQKDNIDPKEVEAEIEKQRNENFAHAIRNAQMDDDGVLALPDISQTTAIEHVIGKRSGPKAVPEIVNLFCGAKPPPKLKYAPRNVINVRLPEKISGVDLPSEFAGTGVPKKPVAPKRKPTATTTKPALAQADS